MSDSLNFRTVSLTQPPKIAFGNGCVSLCVEDLTSSGLSPLFIVTCHPLLQFVDPFAVSLRKAGFSVTIYPEIDTEPNLATIKAALESARSLAPAAVIGIGGGSVLDVAKLVAAMYAGKSNIREVFGVNRLPPRPLFLACLPTTSGTGSEVSPNAILLDETDNKKKGVISPHLVADAAYIDPMLTVGMPPAITAATGFDALTHCIEAYANKHAHPIVDLYAIQGIRLIAANLKRAVEQGDDLEARAHMALGSLYGGLCLAPVNTAAVHALAYPLGGEFHIPHGVSNALLLPHVLEFNLPAAPERYAEVALTLGAKAGSTPLETATNGLILIRQLLHNCGIPSRLSELGIPKNAIPRMAKSALTVTRLLKNNLREIAETDAEKIYAKAY